MSGSEFIFDVQVHNEVPRPPWNANICANNSPTTCPTSWINQIFVATETEVACLSGYPRSGAMDRPHVETRRRLKEIIDMLSGSPRLLMHANVEPEGGTRELDGMEQVASTMPVAAWKTYPSPPGLDSDTVGRPFIERARKTGIKIVNWTGSYSPRDVVGAAKAAPDLTFLVYHSGWQSGVNEAHPFNPMDPAPRGVDRLIKAAVDAGMQPNGGNVYAELGSTWFNLMRNMADAAHVLGKMLKYLGPDRILWGTDALNNGNAKPQIDAFRAFQIPQSMQEMFGYPALTPEVKRKIFGLNGARVYGVDPQAVRKKITSDDIAKIRLARREDPRSVPLGPRPHGPRTRREYFAFLRWSARG
jgi:hypothetical protein